MVLLIFLPLYLSGFSDMDYVMPVKMKYVCDFDLADP